MTMATLTVVCPSCRTANVPGRIHCLGCGNDLTGLQPSAEEVRLAWGSGSGLSPESQALAEKVVGWYRVYCWVLLFLWIIVTPALLSVAFLLPDGEGGGIREQQDRML